MVSLVAMPKAARCGAHGQFTKAFEKRCDNVGCNNYFPEFREELIYPLRLGMSVLPNGSFDRGKGAVTFVRGSEVDVNRPPDPILNLMAVAPAVLVSHAEQERHTQHL
ncbi:hypothetical protein C7476_106150 [Phyllobacterium bourgognense]|uniref:Uncharacterized protein n=1 Tax=Phyllobacterium bourgognense TaxID=314236 RepID=A0A368YVX6_9HYPH|nr:hypothetical protein C7476_106150 [Phyllobacterium bourgognense]